MDSDEDDYLERLAAAYDADKDGLHRTAAFSLARNGFRGTDVGPEDVVSLAVVSLIEHPVANVENYGALLRRAVSLKAVDAVRSSSKSNHRAIAAGKRHLANAPDEFELVDAAADAAGEIKRIRAAIEGLSSDERTVLNSVALHDETQVSIANTLGVSKQRVGQLLEQARFKLRAAIEESKS